jgi:hypothetical protein
MSLKKKEENLMNYKTILRSFWKSTIKLRFMSKLEIWTINLVTQKTFQIKTKNQENPIMKKIIKIVKNQMSSKKKTKNLDKSNSSL